MKDEGRCFNIGQLLFSPCRQRLHIGHEVDYRNLRESRMRRRRIVRFKPDHLLIEAQDPPQYWWVSYAAIQLDAAQAPAPQPQVHVDRSDFALGDSVSFEARDVIQRLGTIIRLNQKSATLSCDGQ